MRADEDVVFDHYGFDIELERFPDVVIGRFDVARFVGGHRNVVADVHVVADGDAARAPEDRIGADLHVVAQTDEPAILIPRRTRAVEIHPVVYLDALAREEALGAAHHDAFAERDGGKPAPQGFIARGLPQSEA